MRSSVRWVAAAEHRRRPLDPLRRETDWVYVRLHGAGDPYRGRYSDAELDDWVDAIADWQANGLDVYVYFNNTTGDGHAPHEAQRLRTRLQDCSE